MLKKNKSKVIKWGKAFFYTFLFLFMISIITLMFMVNLSDAAQVKSISKPWLVIPSALDAQLTEVFLTGSY